MDGNSYYMGPHLREVPNMHKNYHAQKIFHLPAFIVYTSRYIIFYKCIRFNIINA